jgi:tetratricopeptide (TPR) repeat protein
MSRIRFLGLGLAVAISGGTALACGPFFPWQLLDDRNATLTAPPVSGFRFEVSHLVVPKDRLRAVPADNSWPPPTADQIRDRGEAIGVTADEIASIRAMRAADGPKAALEGGKNLPPELRLYTAGAVAFRVGATREAVTQFRHVLDLPVSAPTEARRAVWAAFGLGRVLAWDGKAEQALPAFARTRALALAGAPDPLGLAVASYGEQAAIHLARARAAEKADPGGYATAMKTAIGLYAEQAARGSAEAEDSLRIVADEILEQGSRIALVIDDPRARRLLVADVIATDPLHDGEVAMDQEDNPPAAGDGTPMERLAAALLKVDLDRVDSADRLAAFAYAAGNWELAGRLAARSKSPLASWVRAKLAIQEGKLDLAARDYAEASRAFPETGPIPSIDRDAETRLSGESGVVALARGEYLDAFATLWPLAGTYWGDVAYIAERVLTVDELKAFVDAHVPEPPERSASDEMAGSPVRLRALLARRLVREGRYAAAIAYFPKAGGSAADTPDPRQIVADYAKARAEADGKGSKPERARAAWDAAVIARESGLDIMGTEVAPDYAVTDANFNFGVGQATLDAALTSEGERRRFAASAAVPDLRFHYRFLAVDQAVAAADLLPPRSQAFAAVLCQATQWLFESESVPGVDAAARARGLYHRYVREGAYQPWAKKFGRTCPEPDFDAAATIGYERPKPSLRHWLSEHRRPIGVVLLLCAGLAVLGIWGPRLRRRS